jgi:(p)ppGpp synthase/HD superfamily hydrolase
LAETEAEVLQVLRSPVGRDTVSSDMQWSVELYRKALKFAANAHGKQIVPGQKYSYVVHLSCVCAEVMNALQFETDVNADLAICCALLHDTLEDTKVPPVELEEAFGRDVWMGVGALTKKKHLSKAAAMADSIDRVLKEPKEVGMVKMADRITNLDQPPEPWSVVKVKKYHEEAKLIHGKLKHCSPYLAKRLLERIHDYEVYTK